MNGKIFPLLLLSSVAWAQIEVRIDNETVPSGGVVQLKVGLTDPHPISTGKMSGAFDESYFDGIFGVALFSGSGDVSGAAVVQGARISARFTSPLAGFGTTLDYPLMTIVIGTKATANGTKQDVQLDAANSFWQGLLGDNIAYTLKKGTITTGGTVYIRNIVPGGGLLPAGSVVSIQGGGFTPATQVTINEVNVSNVAYVSPTEMRVTLGSATEMASRRILVKNPSNNSQATYYSYLRTTPVIVSARPLLNRTEPIFAPARRTGGYLPATPTSPGTYIGLALENDNQTDVDVSLDLISPTGTLLGHAVASLPTGTHYVRDLAEIFGMTPPDNSGVTVTSSTAIHMLGLSADDSAASVGPIVLSAPPAPQLFATPPALSFAYTLGASTPANQAIGITSVGGTFTYACVASPAGAWLGVTPPSGTTPGAAVAFINTAGLTAGTLQGNITCTPGGAPALVIPVTLTVSAAPPQLTPNPASLTFNYQLGTAAPANQALNLTSTSGTLNPTCVASPAATWLGLAPASGPTPLAMAASLNIANLQPGTLQANITCTAAGAAQIVIPVTLTVTAAAPQLTPSPTGLSFSAIAGGASPASQNVNITSTPGAINISASAIVTLPAGGTWLSVTPSGTTPASLAVAINTTGLSAGSYSGLITVVATGASAVTIPVNLTVAAPTVTAAPSSLSFSAVVGGPAIAPQIVTLTSNGGPLSPALTVTPAGQWLSISANSSTTPVTLTVTANANGLAPGVYNGSIGGLGGISIPVTLIVAAASSGGVTPATLTGPAPATPLGPTATFSWTNTGASKYRLQIGRTAGSDDLFTTETTATSVSVPNLPQNGATIYAQLSSFFNGSYLAPVVTTYTTATATLAGGARFVPVAPCRVADTRNPEGAFGGPILEGGSVRDFAIPSSPCGIPAGAQAYSINVTVVPSGLLSFLTTWPAGQPRPLASTLNAFDGGVTSNAAIVPAGANGAISVFVTERTHVILDINGYFTGAQPPEALVFYPAPPCRIGDTRLATGPFGGPTMTAGLTRDFAIPTSPCGIPAAARAYSLNMTVVPTGALSFLTTFPAGQPRPNVSTLNAFDGAVKANAAIVPAGTNGAISVYVTDRTDVIVDINGYFAPPGAGGLAFYPLTPCRVVDTRNAVGVIAGGTTRDIAVPTSGCGTLTGAQAYSMNVTVVPTAPLSFLTAWPTGSTRPLVSTLNSFGGKVLANAALVPAGTAGATSFFATDATHLIVDLNGYFAP